MPNNWPLQAVMDNNCGPNLTIDSADKLPRKGESELQRIVRCYGIEYALDILEQGAVEDGIVSTIRIDGSIFDTDDPMFAGALERDSMAVTKTLRTDGLAETRARWNRLGRSIDRVVMCDFMCDSPQKTATPDYESFRKLAGQFMNRELSRKEFVAAFEAFV